MLSRIKRKTFYRNVYEPHTLFDKPLDTFIPGVKVLSSEHFCTITVVYFENILTKSRKIKFAYIMESANRMKYYGDHIKILKFCRFRDLIRRCTSKTPLSLECIFGDNVNGSCKAHDYWNYCLNNILN